VSAMHGVPLLCLQTGGTSVYCPEALGALRVLGCFSALHGEHKDITVQPDLEDEQAQKALERTRRQSAICRDGKSELPRAKGQ